MATSTPAPAPYLSRKALGAFLQRLRGEAGLTVISVADELEVDRDTVRRWELGVHVPKKVVIKSLSTLYGASDEEMLYLVKLARDSKRPGLWESADVPQQMRQLYESEPAAESIRSLELAAVPGLLQTPEYQEATQRTGLPVSSARATSARSVRERRQAEVFGLQTPPDMTFILAGAVIDNLRAHPDVARGQVERLRDVSKISKVAVLITAGQLHAGMIGSFTVVHPPAGLARPFTYVESVDGGRYVEDRDVVSQYVRTFDAVRASAIPLEEYLNGNTR